MTFNLTPISVKKGDGSLTPIIAYNDGTNNAFANAQLDATGAIISPATSGLQTAGNSSLAVVAANTLPVPGVTALTVGTPAAAGRSFAANCTSAGNVSVTFSDTSTSVYPVSVGLNVFPFAITTVNASGTTAVATYENWK